MRRPLCALLCFLLPLTSCVDREVAVEDLQEQSGEVYLEDGQTLADATWEPSDIDVDEFAQLDNESDSEPSTPRFLTFSRSRSGGGGYSSPRRRSYSSPPRRRYSAPRRRYSGGGGATVIIAPTRRRYGGNTIVVVDGDRRRYGYNSYDSRRRNGYRGDTVVVAGGGGGSIFGTILLLCCCGGLFYFACNRRGGGDTTYVEMDEPMLREEHFNFPPAPPLSNDVREAFCDALRDEYVNRVGNAVGDFMDSLEGEDQRSMEGCIEGVENQIRAASNPDAAITGLRIAWR